MTIHICDFHEPIDKKGSQSCWEYIWSEGRECKKCYQSECYRYKWTKKQCDKELKEMKKVINNNRKVDEARNKLIKVKQNLEEVIKDSKTYQVEYLFVESSIDNINTAILCLDRKLWDDQR